jgi:hypothetical protein
MSTSSDNEASLLPDQNNVASAPDAMESDCLTANFAPETSSLADDCDNVATFASDMSNPVSARAWTSSYSSSANFCTFDQPDLGPLGVNWMSPQYQDNIDWDSLLAGFVVHARTHDQNRGTNIDDSTRALQGHVNMPATVYASDAYQQSPLPLQQSSEMERTQAYSITASAPVLVPTQGRYYVDGTGARAPFGGRLHGRGSVEAIETERPVESGNTVAPTLPSGPGTHTLCSQAAYANMIGHVISDHQCHRIDLRNVIFPSLDQVQHYVDLYFERFYPIFPFIRKASFSHTTLNEWLLLLAVATIGSRYMRRQEGKIPGDLLFAILDATLKNLEYGYKKQVGDEQSDTAFVPGHHTTTLICPSISLLQAGILNIILLQHSNKKAFVERAFIERHYLVEACHSLDLVSCNPGDRGMRSAVHYREQHSHDDWIVRETEIRVGMMIWVTRLSPPCLIFADMNSFWTLSFFSNSTQSL